MTPRLERMKPPLYGALFHEQACSALVLGDSACAGPFHHAALAFYAAKTSAPVVLFCGPGARHHADVARDHLERLAPKPMPAIRQLSSFEDIDVQLAAEALLDKAEDSAAPAIALLDSASPLEAALWKALETEAERRAGG